MCKVYASYFTYLQGLLFFFSFTGKVNEWLRRTEQLLIWWYKAYWMEAERHWSEHFFLPIPLLEPLGIAIWIQANDATVRSIQRSPEGDCYTIYIHCILLPPFLLCLFRWRDGFCKRILDFHDRNVNAADLLNRSNLPGTFVSLVTTGLDFNNPKRGVLGCSPINYT